MIASLLLATALAATPATPATEATAQPQQPVSAYEELARSPSEATISNVLAGDRFDGNDPATLINLGAAYAKLGQKVRALAMYRSAIASRERYDLQLADGRWMDSRAAARLAATALERSDTLVLR